MPLADSTLEPLPDAVTDTQAAFLSDVLPGALASAEAAAIQPGDVVAVVGCGPTGLCAVLCAQLFEPSLVVAIDHHADRLAKAKELGALPLDFQRQKYLARVQEATEGRGADVVIEAVGKAQALDLALELLRPWGTLVTMGLHMDLDFPFPLRDFSFRQLTWRASPLPPVKNYIRRAHRAHRRGATGPVAHRQPRAAPGRGASRLPADGGARGRGAEGAAQALMVGASAPGAPTASSASSRQPGGWPGPSARPRRNPARA